ncbi:uncharacterized protein [Fopius arisanus]|uniref:Uncharacterized protein n=1 Tax=Fopius arisanus TaxID=64838 RepID=A0A0C9R822_9HYME|nr:PREDICTED: uncharacterized protein LOC105262727 [Fopius arisanus]
MASHKILWCTIFLAVWLTEALPRRDSSFEEVTSPRESSGFRFGDEYFTPEATYHTPEKHQKPEGCEKVVKDLMVCMVCKDPETSAKYEQCSYVPQQSERSYSHKSSGRKPKEYESSQSQVAEVRPSLTKESLEEESEESEEASSPYNSGFFSSRGESEEVSSKRPSRTYRAEAETEDETSGEYVPESERLAEKADRSKCREEKRQDGMTCQVCKDPETGGNFEKCAYAYEPNDKGYSYSRSNKFQSPGRSDSGGKKGKTPKKAIRRIDEKNEAEDRNPGESQFTERKIDGKCREVVKDSMTCTVCTDPKTRRNSEQCSYSYDPADKLFTYSQSRSFGSKKDPNSHQKSKETEELPSEH